MGKSNLIPRFSLLPVENPGNEVGVNPQWLFELANHGMYLNTGIQLRAQARARILALYLDVSQTDLAWSLV